MGAWPVRARAYVSGGAVVGGVRSALAVGLRDMERRDLRVCMPVLYFRIL